MCAEVNVVMCSLLYKIIMGVINTKEPQSCLHVCGNRNYLVRQMVL